MNSFPLYTKLNDSWLTPLLVHVGRSCVLPLLLLYATNNPNFSHVLKCHIFFFTHLQKQMHTLTRSGSLKQEEVVPIPILLLSQGLPESAKKSKFPVAALNDTFRCGRTPRLLNCFFLSLTFSGL